MSTHKYKEHIKKLKYHINKTSKLDDSQKSSSVKMIEEWYAEDKAMGTLKDELMKISIFFEEIFSELGIK